MATNHYLNFDKSRKDGSREHFFHFMWGYLLPSLNEILKIETCRNSRKIANKYFFMSCGPVMNKILCEMLSLYNLDYEIIEEDIFASKPTSSKVVLVPRWEVKTKEYAKKEDFQFTSSFMKIISTKLLLHFPLLRRRMIKRNFLSSILNVRANTFRKIDETFNSSKIKAYSGHYLLLKRSPQPKYYEKGGRAEISTYGTTRRKLLGIEDAKQQLRDNGIPVKIFEPGTNTLVEQIEIFKNCKGIVGIKGAEFANIIWMQPKSKVVLIRPVKMPNHPAQRVLSKYLGLNYFELIAEEGNFPVLNADSISQILCS